MNVITPPLPGFIRIGKTQAVNTTKAICKNNNPILIANLKKDKSFMVLNNFQILGRAFLELEKAGDCGKMSLPGDPIEKKGNCRCQKSMCLSHCLYIEIGRD